MGTVAPSLVNRIVLGEAGSGSDRIDNAFGVARNLAASTRRQDAANEHQRMIGNLGFAFIRPKEKPTGCRRFP
ncbi:MAG: hypothetical protein EBS83_08255 [Planctomycetia bacterium]|nr:hypothetical protein [Planctomycetia bacterium]